MPCVALVGITDGSIIRDVDEVEQHDVEDVAVCDFKKTLERLIEIRRSAAELHHGHVVDDEQRNQLEQLSIVVPQPFQCPHSNRGSGNLVARLRVNLADIVEEQSPLERKDVLAFKKLVQFRIFGAQTSQFFFTVLHGPQAVQADGTLVVRKVTQQETHFVTLRNEASQQRVRSLSGLKGI